MNIATRINKLHDRLREKAEQAANRPPVDHTTLSARIASIYTAVESGQRSDARALRIYEIINVAQARCDFADLA